MNGIEDVDFFCFDSKQFMGFLQKIQSTYKPLMNIFA